MYVAPAAVPPIPADCEVAAGVVPLTVPSETVVVAFTPIVPFRGQSALNKNPKSICI